MKKLLMTALLGTLTLSSAAAEPASVYVRPDVRDGVRDFQIAYSIDGKHW